MKKSIVSFYVALLLCVGNIGLCQQATAEAELDRDAAIKAFAQLTENAKSGLKADDAMATAKGTGKFAAVAPVSVPYHTGGTVFDGCNHAVRVWFELSNGRYVNPRAYRWAPGEIFYVHVQSAVPVYVALYQNYRSGHPSRQVYPDAAFPHSYQMHMPGVSTRLPVAFQTDMNFNPEFMSIVVSRADWEGISSHVPQAAPAAVAVATASVSAGGEYASATAIAGILKSAGIAPEQTEIRNEQALAKFAVVNTAGFGGTAEYTIDGTKFRHRSRYSYPRFVRPAYYVRYSNRQHNYINVTNNFYYNNDYFHHRGCYTRTDDVAFYLFSDNGIGHMQITLNKTGRNWRWY